MFKGNIYRLADNWYNLVPIDEYRNRPIKYLEIGLFNGANILTVSDTYAEHPDSVLHGIDPWIDYEQYDEYKGHIEDVYLNFVNNFSICEKAKQKIKIHRGFSNDFIPTFEDNYFDIIYIDGNHEISYVIEDAVLSYRKLKIGGIMIFDDYEYGSDDTDGAKVAIDMFLRLYKAKIDVIGLQNNQMVVRKVK